MFGNFLCDKIVALIPASLHTEILNKSALIQFFHHPIIKNFVRLHHFGSGIVAGSAIDQGFPALVLRANTVEGESIALEDFAKEFPGQLS